MPVSNSSTTSPCRDNHFEDTTWKDVGVQKWTEEWAELVRQISFDSVSRYRLIVGEREGKVCSYPIVCLGDTREREREIEID